MSEQKTHLVMVIAFQDASRGYIIVGSRAEARALAREHQLFNWHVRRMSAERAKDLSWESRAEERLGLL